MIAKMIFYGSGAGKENTA